MPQPEWTIHPLHLKNSLVKQDKLILSAILASIATTMTPFISAAKASQEAWHKLHTLYASKYHTWTMQLMEKLKMNISTCTRWRLLLITEYWPMISTFMFSRDLALIFTKLSIDLSQRKAFILWRIVRSSCWAWYLPVPPWSHHLEAGCVGELHYSAF